MNQGKVLLKVGDVTTVEIFYEIDRGSNGTPYLVEWYVEWFYGDGERDNRRSWNTIMNMSKRLTKIIQLNPVLTTKALEAIWEDYYNE